MWGGVNNVRGSNMAAKEDPVPEEDATELRFGKGLYTKYLSSSFFLKVSRFKFEKHLSGQVKTPF